MHHRTASVRPWRVLSLLPKLTPTTDLGATAVAAYARREGVDVEAFVRQMGPPVPPGQVGRHIAELASSTDHVPGAYLVTPGGLAPAPGTPAP